MQWQEPLAPWGDHESLAAADARAATGDWAGAAEILRQADPTDIGVQIGLMQTEVGAGHAWNAVAQLERLHVDRPDEVVRRYLSAFLLAAADQSRGMTRDERLVVTAAAQVAACESVGTRLLALGLPEYEPHARHLIELAAAGREWAWSDRPIATVHLLAVMVAGLAVAVVGGLAQSIPVVVAGVVLGAAVVAWIVLARRRQAWRTWADRFGPVLWRHGLAD
jgi:hypothetical protein